MKVAVFCCIYLCVLTIQLFFSRRDQSVFWDPTSTSFHPVGWWRQIWSSHSHYRQALSILYCEFSHWYVSYLTGSIVLKPLSSFEPQACVLRVSNTHVYSVFTVCYIDQRARLFVARLSCANVFHVIGGQRMCWLLLCLFKAVLVQPNSLKQKLFMTECFRFEIIVRLL